MSDRRESFTLIGRTSRPEIKIALRLQLGDPHHAAALGGNKTRQQIVQRDILRRHGVAAGGKFETGFGELTDTLRKIGAGGGRMKRPQRLAVNHQRDRHMVGTADAIEMVLDVAECEAHLVEIVR